MSSADSTPSSAELENLGVIFIGFVAATALYGLTFFQTYIYYSRYPRDLAWIRYLAALVCTLDTVATALVSEVLYYYLIIKFDANMDVLYASTTFCFQYMLSVLLTFISQLFFAHRVYQVTGRSRLLTLVLVFLTFIALVFGLSATAQLFMQRRLSAFGSLKMEITASISLISNVMVDVTVFITMCHSLRRARFPEIVAPKNFLQMIAKMLVGRGLAFTVTQLAYLCVFLAAPSRQFWVPLQMVSCKIYVNTLFGHLNSRDVQQGQGLYEEDSLIDRKLPPNPRLPTSIRFNVGDAKATTQSIHLNTRNTDTESDGTELDSRKTCQDDSGVLYAQVSTVGTTSTKSQTDHEADKRSLSERSA